MGISHEDLLVAIFAAEIQMAEEMAEGNVQPETLEDWCRLEIRDYDANQLLESVHRHVKGLSVYKLRKYHIAMLNLIADEIEFRRLYMLNTQETEENG